MNIDILLDQNIYNALFTQHSSFNLGVAISTISIFITLIGFTFQKKFELRFRLRKYYFFIIGILVLLSICLLILSEVGVFGDNAIHVEIVSAILMILAIITSSIFIFFPIRKIYYFNIKDLYENLSSFLVQKNDRDTIDHLEDIRYFYKSLLKLSLSNDFARRIFVYIFQSNYFLKIFSENTFLFDETIRFALQESGENKIHIFRFVHKFFVFSLNNQGSFINLLTREDIYPGALSYLDDLFLNHSHINFQYVLFEDVMFGVTHEGRVSYLRLVKRYFDIIYRSNNHASFMRDGNNGYKKNIEYNDNLIEDFLRNIKHFFKFAYGENTEIKELFDELRNIGWGYQFGNKFSDKSDRLKKMVGEFIYEVLENNSGRKLEDHDSTLRLQVIDLFDHFIEQRHREHEYNPAFDIFIKKTVDKITKDEFGSNALGYFPPMMKMYFLIFGFELFSNKSSDYVKDNLHLPILKKLKESFPKLYSGFKQEFYNEKSLPIGKEKKLQREGRETVSSYLPENMNYDFTSNTLEYYYSGNNRGAKISLNQFSETSTEIEIQEI